MLESFIHSIFFGIAVTAIAFAIASLIQKRFKAAIFNPLLVATILCIIFLVSCDIEYQDYKLGAKYISYILTPATICLAIPLYRQIDHLKKNWPAALAGIISGVITNLIVISAMTGIFHLSRKEWITFLPKSITTAIGMGIVDALGGYTSITVVSIMITGVFGNIVAQTICNVTGITDPMAVGIAVGTSSHAAGTSRAIQLGEVQGAMSSLSIVIAALITLPAILILVSMVP